MRRCVSNASRSATIPATLATHGLDLSSVLRSTVWLADIGQIGEMNEIYDEFFADALPARSTVEAKLANGVGVEIELTAWAPAP